MLEYYINQEFTRKWVLWVVLYITFLNRLLREVIYKTTQTTQTFCIRHLLQNTMLFLYDNMTICNFYNLSENTDCIV